MSNSLFQDYAVLSILNSIERGNNARFSGDGRKLKSATYAEEYPTRIKGYNNRPCGRCDLFVNITYDKDGVWELQEDYVFECKSGVDDLKSGYGLNFEGTRNFLVIPHIHEAHKYRSCPWILTPEYAIDYLAKIGRNDVGVLIIDSGTVCCIKESWLNEPLGYLFAVAFGDEVNLYE